MERDKGWKEQQELKKNNDLDLVPSKEKKWKN